MARGRQRRFFLYTMADMSDTICVLGREEALSVAELEAVFGPEHVQGLTIETALVQAEISPTAFRRLGGTQKIANVLTTVATMDEATKWLSAERIGEILGEDGRDLGLSLYGVSPRVKQSLGRVMLTRKKEARAQGHAIRIVTSREPHLSAVTVQRQGLLRHGAEIVIVQTDNNVVIGKTTAVQDYQSYGLRDFGRPAADARSGMLPPKVAQIMLNIAQVTPDDILLDPFCGSGTILQEAALMGVEHLRGSDTSQRAVRDTQKNMRWLVQEFPDLQVDAEIILEDATHGTFRPTVIVTEPFLGKPMRGHESFAELHHQANELRTLYAATFSHWARVLASESRVVMIWPDFPDAESRLTTPLLNDIERFGFRVAPVLSATNAHLYQASETMVKYAREQAIVKRQIRRFIKK